MVIDLVKTPPNQTDSESSMSDIKCKILMGNYSKAVSLVYHECVTHLEDT